MKINANLLIDAIGKIDDSDIVLAEKQVEYVTPVIVRTKRRGFFSQQAMLIAAATLVFVIGTVLMLHFFAPVDPIDLTPAASDTSAATSQATEATSGIDTTLPDSAFSGLHVDNTRIGNSEITEGRFYYTQFRDFFTVGPIDAFLLVKVTETNRRVHEDGDYQDEMWDSDVQVLLEVYSNGMAVPETLTITQNYFAHDYGEALRKGGIYLLPISHFIWEDFESIQIAGDRDVLFEVDEKGKVWSRSHREAFNKFDGMGVTEVVNVISDMTSHPDFRLAVSEFGKAAGAGYTLAEITVTGIRKVERDDWAGNYNYFADITIDEIYIHGDFQPQFSLGEYETLPWNPSLFEAGERYLLYLADTGTVGFVLYGHLGARLEADGTVSQIIDPDNEEFSSCFDGHYGKTVPELIELIKRAALWYDLY
jgi:hypothetical protein